MKTNNSKRKRTIFVTVGTTLFQALIDVVTSESALQWMVSNGYTHLIVQYGKGTIPVAYNNYDIPPISIEYYDFKSSLQNDMKNADLIISHAGAGTVMECLSLKKKLVVVINTLLMDNHQLELANAMGIRGHLFVVDNPKLLNDNMKTWDTLEAFQPVPKEPGDTHDFTRLLNHFCFGSNDNKKSS